MSEKDEEDLRWAVKVGADLIALSFVRSAADYNDVRRIMEEEGRIVPVIAKIEKPQAVENLTEIVAAFDGIMVARGDLGVELPLEQVPLVQKRAVELARRNAMRSPRRTAGTASALMVGVAVATLFSVVAASVIQERLLQKH